MTSAPRRERASKTLLFAELVKRIRADVIALTRTQEDTRAAATHQENRAEHAKDTRASEQSYLARGLAERVETLRRTEKLLTRLVVQTFSPESPIRLTARIEIQDDLADTPQAWLLVPAGGGIELGSAAAVVRTITPTAPLGRALIGLHVRDEASFRTPRGTRHFRILFVD